LLTIIGPKGKHRYQFTTTTLLFASEYFKELLSIKSENGRVQIDHSSEKLEVECYDKVMRMLHGEELIL
jgi:hypothetical protein